MARQTLRQMGAIVANVTFEVRAILLTSKKTAMSRSLLLRMLILCLI